MKFKVLIGKILLSSLGKLLPNKGFRWFRTGLARMISSGVNKKANICKGARINGDGTNLFIGSHAAIGINCQVASNLTIEDGVMMGPECVIITQNHKYHQDTHKLEGYETKPVHIGKKCWIGTRVIILPGAKIGSNCIIGAGAVVPGKEYPDNCLIAGNPAVVVKKLV